MPARTQSFFLGTRVCLNKDITDVTQCGHHESCFHCLIMSFWSTQGVGSLLWSYPCCLAMCVQLLRVDQPNTDSREEVLHCPHFQWPLSGMARLGVLIWLHSAASQWITNWTFRWLSESLKSLFPSPQTVSSFFQTENGGGTCRCSASKSSVVSMGSGRINISMDRNNTSGLVFWSF